MHSALSSLAAFLLITTSYTISITDGFSTVTPLRAVFPTTRTPAAGDYYRHSTPRHVFLDDDQDGTVNNNDDEDDDDEGEEDIMNFFHQNQNQFLDIDQIRQELEAIVSHSRVGQEEVSFYEELKLRAEEMVEQQQQQTNQNQPQNHPNPQQDKNEMTVQVRAPTYHRSRPSPLPALDVALPPAPPLTTMDRERRQVEIQLLRRLADGDESVSDLWTLWFGERGREAAQKLLQAEALTSTTSTTSMGQWAEAEDILRSLIEEHGVYWVEPVNRLATLYYMTGRLDEAETLNKIVLAIKPWHFGALSGIVMIYAAQADSEKARLWAASRLPTWAPTGSNRRRRAWAEKAVQSAEESLANAERRIQELFGAPDDYEAMRQQQQRDAWGNYHVDNGDSAAWQ